MRFGWAWHKPMAEVAVEQLLQPQNLWPIAIGQRLP
jgi:hypothetical protein